MFCLLDTLVHFFFLYHFYPEFEKNENTQNEQCKCEYYKQVVDAGFIYFGKKPQDHFEIFCEE